MKAERESSCEFFFHLHLSCEFPLLGVLNRIWRVPPLPNKNTMFIFPGKKTLGPQKCGLTGGAKLCGKLFEETKIKSVKNQSSISESCLGSTSGFLGSPRNEQKALSELFSPLFSTRRTNLGRGARTHTSTSPCVSLPWRTEERIDKVQRRRFSLSATPWITKA